jgi:hypothetical protein
MESMSKLLGELNIPEISIVWWFETLFMAFDPHKLPIDNNPWVSSLNHAQGFEIYLLFLKPPNGAPITT